jgi:hypothetical protein
MEKKNNFFFKLSNLLHLRKDFTENKRLYKLCKFNEICNLCIIFNLYNTKIIST